LSILADRNDSERLLVRGRFPDDIANVFPEAEVIKTTDADYRYRAFLPRDVVSMRIADIVSEIGYPNFKSSV